MKNKYLVTFLVPTAELEYNTYIPNNKKVGTIKHYCLQSIREMSGNSFNKQDNETQFIDRDTGLSIPLDVYVKDSGIKNGTKIIIM